MNKTKQYFGMGIVLILINCNMIIGTSSKDKDSQKNTLTALAISQLGNSSNSNANCTSVTTTNGTFTDCLDGTIKYVGAGYFAGEKLTYAKCPNGLTFDGTTCTGTLTQTIWCSDNINNNNTSTLCETSSVLTSGPLFNLCDTKSLGGKKWRLPSPIEIKKLIKCKDGTSPISNPPVAFEACANGNIYSNPNFEVVDSTYKEVFPKIPYFLATKLAFDSSYSWYINFNNTQERNTGGKASNTYSLCVSDD